MRNWELKAIKQLQAAGQTIIDNAEIMIGGYKFQTGDIDIHITISYQEAPEISVEQRLLPDDIKNIV